MDKLILTVGCVAMFGLGLSAYQGCERLHQANLVDEQKLRHLTVTAADGRVLVDSPVRGRVHYLDSRTITWVTPEGVQHWYFYGLDHTIHVKDN